MCPSQAGFRVFTETLARERIAPIPFDEIYGRLAFDELKLVSRFQLSITIEGRTMLVSTRVFRSAKLLNLQALAHIRRVPIHNARGWRETARRLLQYLESGE